MRHLLAIAVCVALLAGFSRADDPAPAADASKPVDIAQQSLPLRTALHHDPLLDAPLERLLALYRGANRQEELLSLYRKHVAQFADDPNGTIVLIRLLAACGDAESDRLAADAMVRFPKDAGIHFVAATLAGKRQHPKAVDFLDRAIELQSEPARKAAWIALLLDAANLQERRDLISKHLLSQVPLAASAEARVDLARKMNKYKLYELVLELAKKTDASTAAEAMVAMELEAATAEIGLQHPAAAATRLDRLLGRLSADYWQRTAIVRRRLALVATQSERDDIIRRARQRVAERPQDETAVLDLAQVLAGLDFRREAIDMLKESLKRLPQSEPIEKRCLELLDDLRDEHAREAFLVQRMKQLPQRADLVLAHVKSLYALGRAKEAAGELDAALEKQPLAEQNAQLLQIARMLRRSTMNAEAVELFDRVVRRSPDRFDLRREMAETCLAAGDRRKVRELMAGLDPTKVEQENLLDLIPFMIQQEFYPEAKAILVKRLATEKDSLELRLLLIDVERRLGSAEAGAARLIETRTLADTSARYRQWLEAAAAFHKEFDTLDAFFKGELARLDAEPKAWTDKRLERRLAFIEVAGHGEQRAMVSNVLQRDLASAPPKAMVLKLRRQLIAILDESTAGGGDLATQIEQLAMDDPQLRQESTARLVLWHLKQQRHDLAHLALQQLDVSKLADADLLGALRLAYEQIGATRPQMLALLQRVTEVAPTDRTAWERWISGLAADRDEIRLMAAIRRLLAGVEGMPLSSATCDALRGQLFDAQTRLALRRIAAGTDASLADALSELTAAERTVREDAQGLWITWLQAFVLNRLDRYKARDEAIAEMERMVRKMQAGEKTPAESLRIGYPDGLTMSLARARQMLTAARTPPEIPPSVRREGPMPPLRLRWSFDTLQSPVALVLPLNGNRVLVGDNKGTLFCLDKTSGKLLWQQMQGLRMATAQPQGSSYDDGRQIAAPPTQKLLADAADRIFIPECGVVTCRSADDGSLLWSFNVAASQNSILGGRTDVAMFLDGATLIAADPTSGTVAKIDPTTGKAIWERVIPADKQATAPACSGGASLSGRRLLVYGARTGIVDIDTGDLEWSFESWRVKKFPVKLLDTDATPEDPYVGVLANAGAAPVAPAAYSSAPVYYRRNGRIYLLSQRVAPQPGFAATSPAQQVAAFDDPESGVVAGIPQVEFSLTGPAVTWANQVRQNSGCFGLLNGPILLLGEPASIRSIRLDLPFVSHRFSVVGEPAGVVGRYAFATNGVNLQILDMIKGSSRTATPGRESTDGAQWVVDGPAIYFTAYSGILCVRTTTGQRVFASQWPASADIRKPTLPLQVAPPALGNSNDPLGVSTSPAYGAPVRPNVARVSQGVLYTLASPTRVVALTGAEDHGN